MSWWDYGYQITAMANRTILVDNNTWNNTHISRVGQVRQHVMNTCFSLQGNNSRNNAQLALCSAWSHAQIPLSNGSLDGRKELEGRNMIGLATGDKLARLLVTIVNAQSRKRMDLAGKCCCFCFKLSDRSVQRSCLYKRKSFFQRENKYTALFSPLFILSGETYCMYVKAGFHQQRSWSRSRQRTCKSAHDLVKNKNVSRKW